jgi:hypothetical protein
VAKIQLTPDQIRWLDGALRARYLWRTEPGNEDAITARCRPLGVRVEHLNTLESNEVSIIVTSPGRDEEAVNLRPDQFMWLLGVDLGWLHHEVVSGTGLIDEYDSIDCAELGIGVTATAGGVEVATWEVAP